MFKKIITYFACLSFILLNCPAIAQRATSNVTGTFYHLASKGNQAQIKTLISKGYNINETDRNGNTALCMAARQKNLLAYETLLKLGASTRSECMKHLQNPKATQNNGQISTSQKMIYLNGGLSESTYGKKQTTIQEDSSFWTAQNQVLAGLVVIGGAATGIALASGGGGGGGSGSSSDPSSDILKAEVPACLGGSWSQKDGSYVCVCPAGKTLKNGVCVATQETYQTSNISNDGTIVLTTAQDTLVAELGASATNNGTISGTTSAFDLVAMRVNGFSDDSGYENMTPETKLDSSAASVAYNNGTISLAHDSLNSTYRLYGIQALAGANAQTKGEIALNVKGSGNAYGVYAENVNYGLKNEGTIRLNLSQNALNAYGLYAEERAAVNNNTIIATITNPIFQQNLSGVVAGMYGNSQQNSGSILLRRGETSNTALTESNLNFYAMYVKNNGSAENLENGLISLNVSGMPFYNYGIYADQGTAGITNKGRIEIFGSLASKESTAGVGGAYGIRFTGGIGSIINEGEIETRHYNETTKSYENLAIIDNAYLSLIKGFNGTIHNKSDLYMTIDNKVPVGTSAGWTLAGIDLQNDDSESSESILNDADLYITINNVENYNTAVTADSKVYGLYSGLASIKNNGDINISSPVNNLNVYGISGDTLINSQYSIIDITGSGANSFLSGIDSGGLEASDQQNLGTIKIMHLSSGGMQGTAGSNEGVINLTALPNTDSAISMDTTGVHGKTNSGQINISLQKGAAGNTYGIYDYNSTSKEASNTGNISINLENRTTTSIGNLFGIASYNNSTSTASVTNSGLISIDALTNIPETLELSGSLFGIKTEPTNETTAHGTNITNTVKGKIDLQLNGGTIESIVGMMNNSGIVIDSETKPEIYTITNNGTIHIKAMNTQSINLSLPNLTGSYTNGNKSITVGSDSAATTTIPFNIVGMLTNSVAVNNGDILLEVSGDAKVAGMVAYDGGIAVNARGGMIEFRGNSSNFTALYGTGKRTIVEEETSEEEGKKEGEEVTTNTKKTTTQYSTVINYGTIKINETQYLADNSETLVTITNNAVVAEALSEGNPPTHANEIVETVKTKDSESQTTTDTSNYYPVIRTSSATPNLSTTILNQGVDYISEEGGVFSAENTHVVGDVLAGVTLTQEGNKNIYIASGAGEGVVIGDGDATDLSLASMSAMFDASWATNAQNENGLDIVMTKKNFNEITNNQSLAAFLEKNYALGNNEAFFNDLKSIDNVSNFNATLNSITGIDTFSRFAYEDLAAMRELNFEMNKLMFANDDKPLFTAQGSMNGFSFNSNSATGASYALSSKRISPRWKVGYAISRTDLKADNDDTDRHNQIFQVFAPISYDRNGLKLISTPQLAYMRSHYTRDGYQGASFDGVIEKRVLAFMNEARYPILIGGLELAPTVEFNAITYNQRGSEDKKDYALRIPTDTNVSVEAGFGFYANKEQKIGFDSKFSLSAGLMMYREFADPYDIKLGMQGMSGTFDLYDNQKDYRAVASFGFNYALGTVDVYGNVQHFMESDTHTVAKTGLKIGF